MRDEPPCSFCGANEDTNIHYIFHCFHFKNVRHFPTKRFPFTTVQRQQNRIPISCLIDYISRSNRFGNPMMQNRIFFFWEIWVPWAPGACILTVEMMIIQKPDCVTYPQAPNTEDGDKLTNHTKCSNYPALMGMDKLGSQCCMERSPTWVVRRTPTCDLPSVKPEQ